MSVCASTFSSLLFGSRHGPGCRFCRSGPALQSPSLNRALLAALAPGWSRGGAFLDAGPVETNIWECLEDPSPGPPPGRLGYARPEPTEGPPSDG